MMDLHICGIIFIEFWRNNMEILGEGLKALGGAVGSIALWWGLVQVAKIGALTYLVSEKEVPFDKVSKFFEMGQRKRGF